MNSDFHYYATYCAAVLAGYSHQDSLVISAADVFTDSCSRTLLSKLKAPQSAATTQLKLELMDAHTDTSGLQDITRIWSSFHFLPYDLSAEPPQRTSKRYKAKYRLICQPNGKLLKQTVKLAKGKSLEAAGIAMHVLADTWAHRHFAGTPSLVINNPYNEFVELIPEGNGFSERMLTFRHSPSAPDDLERGIYTCSLYSNSEKSIMNLGHGRAGHLPDYCFIRYQYLPAWGNYKEYVKDNPSDYRYAFAQMIYAMKYLRGVHTDFELKKYDWKAVAGIENDLHDILEKQQLDASDDWRALGERLSGKTIKPFDMEAVQQEYLSAEADKKDNTFLGSFILAALAQKSMVTNQIFASGNKLAGRSIEYVRRGIRLARTIKEGKK